MPDEFITYEESEVRPSFDTPAKDFEEVWEPGVEVPEIFAMLNKACYLSFLSHWATLYAVDTVRRVDGKDHVGASIWAESFDGYHANIDIEKMFCAIPADENEPAMLEKMIASFRRIIAHLEGLRR